MRNKECSEEVKQLIKDGRKKFVRVDEGAFLYSMGVHSFRKLAAEANAVYHIKKTVLVNTKIVDEYLEHFRDAYAEYRSIKEENKELQMAKHNLERFLNQQDKEQKAKEKQHNKNGQSL